MDSVDEGALFSERNRKPVEDQKDVTDCYKQASDADDKRTRFSASQHSSGYSSADCSNWSETTSGPLDEDGAVGEEHYDEDLHDGSFLRRQHRVDSESDSSSSTSFESSDSDDNIEDDYRVERRELREIEINRCRHPRFYSPLSTISNENTLIFMKSDCTTDGQDDELDEDNTCTSSLESKSSEYMYKIVKRKSAYLKIYKIVDFCKIQAVVYTLGKKKFIQHYKKNLRPDEKDIEGNIGLKEGDLLLKINGKRLENRKLKSVLKIFRKIRPRHRDGIIRIHLVIFTIFLY